MGLPRTYKTLEENTTLGRKKGMDDKDRYFPTLEEYLRRVERNQILKVLTKCCWNLSLAAEMLDISRPTLANKIKLYNLNRPDIKLSKRKMDYLICHYIDGDLTKDEKIEIKEYFDNDSDFKAIYEEIVKKLEELSQEDPTALPHEII